MKRIVRKLLFLILIFILIIPPTRGHEDHYNISETIRMPSGRLLNITVSYHEGHEGWANGILKMSSTWLPIIERKAGYPYPPKIPLFIFEATIDEMQGQDAQGLNKGPQGIAIRYYHPDPLTYGTPNTLVHEISHYWIKPDTETGNTSDEKILWIQEGHANYLTYYILDSPNSAFTFRKDLISHNEIIQKLIKSLQLVPDTPVANWPMIVIKIPSAGGKLYKIPSAGGDSYNVVKGKSWLFFEKIELILGDEILKKAFQILNEENKEIKNITTFWGVMEINGGVVKNNEEFIRALEIASNKNLTYFFSGWVYEGPYRNEEGKIVSLGYYVNDDDNDDLINMYEKYKYNTNLTNPDTDGDGVFDGDEISKGTNPLNAEIARQPITTPIPSLTNGTRERKKILGLIVLILLGYVIYLKKIRQS